MVQWGPPGAVEGHQQVAQAGPAKKVTTQYFCNKTLYETLKASVQSRTAKHTAKDDEDGHFLFSLLSGLPHVAPLHRVQTNQPCSCRGDRTQYSSLG